MADQGSEGLLSPYLRSKRIKAVRPYLKGRILDVGCGVGSLAKFVSADHYWGVDIDSESLDTARLTYPHHNFSSELPVIETGFDSVIALAVIEHIHDQLKFLKELACRLSPETGNQIILTTPNPHLDWIHTTGASVGLFSRHASEEHEKLLTYTDIKKLAAECGLASTYYYRFLLGANQLFILERI